MNLGHCNLFEYPQIVPVLDKQYNSCKRASASKTKDFANVSQPFACDGNAAVDWWVQSQVVVF